MSYNGILPNVLLCLTMVYYLIFNMSYNGILPNILLCLTMVYYLIFYYVLQWYTT